MAVCGWCGSELPWRMDGRETRRYCNPSHRQQAYLARLTPEARAEVRRKAAARRKRNRGG